MKKIKHKKVDDLLSVDKLMANSKKVKEEEPSPFWEAPEPIKEEKKELEVKKNNQIEDICNAISNFYTKKTKSNDELIISIERNDKDYTITLGNDEKDIGTYKLIEDDFNQDKLNKIIRSYGIKNIIAVEQKNNQNACMFISSNGSILELINIEFDSKKIKKVLEEAQKEGKIINKEDALLAFDNKPVLFKNNKNIRFKKVYRKRNMKHALILSIILLLAGFIFILSIK